MIDTHTVTNQSQPLVGVNLFDGNRGLQDALAFHHPGYDKPRFQQLGAKLGSAEVQSHARLANVHPPLLRTHDRFGHRSDSVEFHPSYHALMTLACSERLHGSPWLEGPGAHIERAAAFMLFTEAEPSVLCPISMTYAVAPALRANPGVHAAWSAGLASPQYDNRFIPFDQKTGLTMGMGMTEKQGGSDVRANTTAATFDGDDAWGRRYRITGHKWFMSAPMCDAFLVLAQTAAGLSCFFLPRCLPRFAHDGSTNGSVTGNVNGRVNAIHIQRLKDKLGNKANASSEVEFHDATAWLVGEEGRGVPQILAMGAMTRLDCALGTAGLMRQALSLAIHHTSQRKAFGKALIDQPLMQNVLADLAVESEAATALAMRLARAVDRSEHDPGDEHEAVMRRLLTPVAKFWVCKRGSHFAQEAMECLGGNGYVEERGEGAMARIYREMPLNSIWEGAANIMALDLLRALRKGGRDGDCVGALATELAGSRGAHAAFDGFVAALFERIELGADEVESRRLAQDIALAVQASLLHRHAPPFVFDAFCASRLGRGAGAAPGGAFGTLSASTDFASILARAQPT
jgi:putative acyl-CoA dehydrogenase